MADLKDANLRFYKEVFENRNLDAIDDLVAEDVIEHEQPPPGVTLKPGRAGVKQLCELYLDAFSPMGVEVHEQYQGGPTVISPVTIHGTHKEPSSGSRRQGSPSALR